MQKSTPLVINTTIRNDILRYYIDDAIQSIMKRYAMGEFEELVLLTVGVLYDQAYGVMIKDEIESRFDRKVSVGALQSALRRMEKKGYLKSHFGEKTEQRGGRRKRYFTMTRTGKRALETSRNIRNQLWNDIPDIAFDF